jgi:hypothetical protein
MRCGKNFVGAIALLLLGLPGCLPLVTGTAALARTSPPVQKIVVQVKRARVLVDGREMTGGDTEIKQAITRPGCNELVLRGDARSDEATLVKIVRMAPSAQLCTLSLEVDEVHVDIPLSVRERTDDKAAKTLVAVADVQQSELWSVHNESGSFEKLGSWPPGDSASEATARNEVKDECGTGGCRVALDIDERAGFMASLRAWQRVLGEQGKTMWVGVLPREELEYAATNVSGRLQPGLIQAIVRAGFGAFRQCYEAGLSRDPKLAGIVNARFVIDRDGTVKHVADHESTLRDEKVKICVLQSFYKLRFPPSAGGIVTVVYPVQLEPD